MCDRQSRIPWAHRSCRRWRRGIAAVAAAGRVQGEAGRQESLSSSWGPGQAGSAGERRSGFNAGRKRNACAQTYMYTYVCVCTRACIRGMSPGGIGT